MKRFKLPTLTATDGSRAGHDFYTITHVDRRRGVVYILEINKVEKITIREALSWGWKLNAEARRVLAKEKKK